eukprot:Rhum_TRINITY_DN11226_c0_g1::Rhum_TRINITY_DN11226_c0_g1_i1::g.43459::m.43459
MRRVVLAEVVHRQQLLVLLRVAQVEGHGAERRHHKIVVPERRQLPGHRLRREEPGLLKVLDRLRLVRVLRAGGQHRLAHLASQLLVDARQGHLAQPSALHDDLLRLRRVQQGDERGTRVVFAEVREAEHAARRVGDDDAVRGAHLLDCDEVVRLVVHQHLELRQRAQRQQLRQLAGDDSLRAARPVQLPARLHLLDSPHLMPSADEPGCPQVEVLLGDADHAHARAGGVRHLQVEVLAADVGVPLVELVELALLEEQHRVPVHHLDLPVLALEVRHRLERRLGHVQPAVVVVLLLRAPAFLVHDVTEEAVLQAVLVLRVLVACILAVLPHRLPLGVDRNVPELRSLRSWRSGEHHFFLPADHPAPSCNEVQIL